MVADNYAYLGNSSFTLSSLYARPALFIADVSNTAIPVEVGSFPKTGAASVVAIAGHYAYVGGQQVSILDVSNPAAPREVRVLEDLGGYSIAPAGNYAYVAAASQGLRIVDISDPTNAVEVGQYTEMRVAYGVAVAGPYAYVSALDQGLYIVDITDPHHPSKVGSLSMSGYAKGIAVAGTRLFVTMGQSPWGTPVVQGGLRVVDVSNPRNPIEVGDYDLPKDPQSVAISGHYAYVATGYAAGLHILDVSDPASPTEVGFYNPHGSAWHVSLAGPYAYLAAGDGGLYILRFVDADPVPHRLYLPLVVPNQ